MPNKVLITGRPGAGKTTVVRKVVSAGMPLAGGFFTEEIRRGGSRVGFKVRDVHSGQEGVLAHVDHKHGPRVGKYGVDVASFDGIGVNALREAMRRRGCIVIDEIGNMELCSDAFQETVAAVMDSDRAVLGTVPIHRHPFLDGLLQRSDVTVIEVTFSNRDGLPARVASILKLTDQAAP